MWLSTALLGSLLLGRVAEPSESIPCTRCVPHFVVSAGTGNLRRVNEVSNFDSPRLRHSLPCRWLEHSANLALVWKSKLGRYEAPAKAGQAPYNPSGTAVMRVARPERRESVSRIAAGRALRAKRSPPPT